jgi:hypothetical protein
MRSRSRILSHGRAARESCLSPSTPRRRRHRALLVAAGAVTTLISAAPPLSAATTIGQSGDGVPDFFYDAATGDLRFSYDGLTPVTLGGELGVLSSLVVQSTSGQLIPNNVNPTFALGLTATLQPSLLASAIVNPPGFTDGFDLGNVLPAGLPTDLTADLTLRYQTMNGGALKVANVIFNVAPAPPVNAFTGTNVLWSNSANWSLARPPVARDKVSLTATNTGSLSITIDQDAQNLIELRADALSGSSLDIALADSHSLSTLTNMTIGYSGSVSFTQSSGSNAVAASVFLGVAPGSHGVYNLSGGTLSAARIVVGAGGAADIGGGRGGSGVFTQTGGFVAVGGSNSADGLILGNASNSAGTFSLSGTGSLVVVGNEKIGNGIFIQSGGTHTVSPNSFSESGIIYIGGFNNPTRPAFTLSGGTLSARSIENYGTLNIFGGTLLAPVTGYGTVVLAAGLDASTLQLNSYSRVTLAPGTAPASIYSLSVPIGAKVDVAAAGISLSANTLNGVRYWVGIGAITSSLAASDPHHWAVASADNGGSVLVRAALIGDVNLDGNVDDSDVGQILDHGRFNVRHTGTTEDGWIDGDVNYDGVVNNIDIRTIALSGNYVGTPPAAAKASASAITVPAAGQGLPGFSYDPTTGDVTFLADGVTNIVDLHLRSVSGKFLPANSTFTSFPTVTTKELESTLFGSTFDTGYDLGAILPTGLTLPILQADLTLLHGVSGAGVEQSATITVVPEPTSTGCCAMALAAAGVMFQRRRRQRQPPPVPLERVHAAAR